MWAHKGLYGPIWARMAPYGPGPGPYEGETLYEGKYEPYAAMLELPCFLDPNGCRCSRKCLQDLLP